MADIDDLEGALSTDAVGIVQKRLIRYPESFSPNHTFVDLDGTEFTAGQLAEASAARTDPDIDGYLVDQDGTRYFPDLDEDGNLFLRVVGGEHSGAFSDDSAVVRLTDDQYRWYLNSLEKALQKICYYLSLSGRLHKEAVQDAVDAVQSKRLDFLETRDEDVALGGVISAVVFVVLMETGVPGLILSQLFQAAAKLASKKFMRNAMNSVLALMGKRSGKLADSVNVSNIKDLDARIFALSTKARNLEAAIYSKVENLELAIKGKLVDPKKSKELNEEILDLFKHLAGRLETKGVWEEQKKMYEARLRDEVITFGKDEVDRLRSSFVRKAKDAKEIAKAIGEQVAENVLPVTLRNMIVQDLPLDAPFVVPADVYVKSFIQTFYEEQLQVFERLLALARDLINNLELRQMSTMEDVTLHKEALSLFPGEDVLLGIMKDYTEIFNKDFSYQITKEYQTKEYELLIWSFLLRSKLKTITPQVFAGTALEAIEEFARQQRYIEELTKDLGEYYLDVKPPLCEYLSQRFGIKKDSHVIGFFISYTVQNFSAALHLVNKTLTAENASVYQAVIKSSTRPPHPK